jgi:predicted metal-dependent HD superfamily phosphohydrolase
VVGRPVSVSPGAKRWPCGAYEEDGRAIVVTGGVGTSGLPVRLRAPPEIVIVTLARALPTIPEPILARLQSAYADPRRAYHTMRHVRQSLALLNEVEDLDPDVAKILFYALWWHDAVYDPKRTDNETRSADMAARDLKAMGESRAVIREVTRLIRLTAGHKVEEGDEAGALMVSIDLAILGSSPGEYDGYVGAIRREYAHVPNEAYRLGRTMVLNGFLDSPTIYPDPTFAERFEEQARENIARELEALSPTPEAEEDKK